MNPLSTAPFEFSPAEKGTLKTESGKKIPELNLTAKLLLDRNTVLYGPSNSGKTVIVKYCLSLLKDHIDQIILISPSEPSNRSYEGIVPAPLIHYRVYLPDPGNPKKDDGTKGAARFLEAVCERQDMMASIYTRANNPKTLADLFARLPKQAKAEGIEYINSLNDRRGKVVNAVRKKHETDSGVLKEKEREINEKFKQMLVLLYKRYIVPYHGELLERKDLTPDEKWALHYIKFNPRLLLVFDDCAAELKPMFSKEVFRKIFYQGRHSYITSIICCQDDTDLPANLRKNASLSFFTKAVVCQTNFNRGANSFPKETKSFVSEACSVIFNGHRKMAYIREDPTGNNFYHITAPVVAGVKFGSPALHELCSAVKSEGATFDRSNRFFSKFSVV